MGQVILPKTLQGHTPALADEVMADLNAIVARLNNGLESDNLAANSVGTSEIQDGAVTPSKITGPIDIADFPALATGQFIAGNGGAPTVRTMGGAGLLDASGNLYTPTLEASNFGVGVGAGNTLLLTLALGGGSWVVWGKARISSTIEVPAHLELIDSNAASLDSQDMTAGNGNGTQTAYAGMTCFGRTSAASVSLYGAKGGGGAVADAIRIIAHRYA